MKAKRFFLTLLSLFLFYQSIQLTFAFLQKTSPYTWLGAFFSAIILNLFVTGFWAFLGFAYPSSKLLNENYYKRVNKKFIRTLYRLMKGNLFRLFLLQTFWKKRSQKMKYFKGGKSGINQMFFESKQAEFGHLASFVCISSISLIFILNKQWNALLISQTINIIFNFYPILLQRFLRIRVITLQERLKNDGFN